MNECIKISIQFILILFTFFILAFFSHYFRRDDGDLPIGTVQVKMKNINDRLKILEKEKDENKKG